MHDLVRTVPKGWSPRGDAVAVNAEGRQLHVFGGIPGEDEVVRLINAGEHPATGQFVRSRRADPDRVEPPCPRYSACGACALMHLSADGQVKAHTAIVHADLVAAGLTGAIGTWFPSPDGDKDFRTIITVGLGLTTDGRLKVGVWGRTPREVIPIPECVIAAPILRQTLRSVAHHIIDLDVRPWDAATGGGSLRCVVLRASRATGEVLVTLIAGRRTPILSDLADLVAASSEKIVGVWLHINDGPGDAIFVRDEEGVVGVMPISGRDWIAETLNDVTYRIGPGDFFQSNPGTAATMYARVVDVLQLGPDDAVIELYCGVGGLSLQVAGRAGFVLGVEEIIGAIGRAREAARFNRRTVEFVCERVELALPALAVRMVGVHPTLIINAPRHGLAAVVVEGVISLAPRRIAILSSNSRTLAKNLSAFVTAGYKLRPVELFDMGPHAAGVELLAVLDAPHRPLAARRSPRRSVVRA